MDTMANMFSSIMTALLRRKEVVEVPFSKIKEAVLSILMRQGFIADYEVHARGKKKFIRIKLKYRMDKFGKASESLICGIKKVSKSGGRVYVKAGKIPMVRSGFGCAVISTPQGVMSGDEARKNKVGGELIAYVW